jgi:hypothetical protein
LDSFVALGGLGDKKGNSGDVYSQQRACLLNLAVFGGGRFQKNCSLVGFSLSLSLSLSL